MSDKPLQILLIEDNPGDALLVREMLAEVDPESFTVHRAESLLEGLDRFAQHGADVILLDLSLPDSHGLETFTTMQTQAPGTPIVLLTGNDDDSMAISAVHSGAQDYLVKDRLTGDSLVRALRYAVVRRQGQSGAEASEPLSRGGLIGVLGSKGGVGTTTVACHLAAAIRGLTGKKVLLADLDLDGGAVGFLMQCKGAYSILDAAANIHRLDEAFWEMIIGKGAQDVDVITSPCLMGAEGPPKGRLRHTLRFTRTNYPWTVVDMGRMNASNLELAADLSTMLLVSSGDLVAARSLNQTWEALIGAGVQEEDIMVVHNRAEKWSPDADVIEGVVPARIRGSVPECRSDLATAYTKGHLLNGDTDFGRAILELATAVTGVTAKSGGESGFSLRRFSLFGPRTGEQQGAAGN